MEFSSIEELRSLLREYGLKERLIEDIVRIIIRLHIYRFLDREEIDNVIVGILRSLGIVDIGDVYPISSGSLGIKYERMKHIMLKYEVIDKAVENYLKSVYVKEKEKIEDVLDVIGFNRFAYLLSFKFSKITYGRGVECWCSLSEEFVRETWRDLCRLAKIVYGYCEKSDEWIKIAYPLTFVKWLLEGKSIPKIGKVLSYFMALKIIYNYCLGSFRNTFDELKKVIKEKGLTLYELELVVKDLHEKGLVSRFKEGDPPFLCLSVPENIKAYALNIAKEEQNLGIHMLPYFEILKPTDNIERIRTKIKTIFRLFRNDVFGILSYIDKTTFELLDLIPKDLGLKIIISCKKLSDAKLKEHADKLKESRPSVEIIEIKQLMEGEKKPYLHDRWLSDNEVFVDLDRDLKLSSLRNKEVHIEVQRAFLKEEFIKRFNELWEKTEDELNKELGKKQLRIVKRKIYP